jgi:hypothetical protein
MAKIKISKEEHEELFSMNEEIVRLKIAVADSMLEHNITNNNLLNALINLNIKREIYTNKIAVFGKSYNVNEDWVLDINKGEFIKSKIKK